MKTIDITYSDFFRFLQFDENVETEKILTLSDEDGDGSYYAVTPDGNFTTIHHVIKKPKQSYVGVFITLPNGSSIVKEVSPNHIFSSGGKNLFAKDSEGKYIDTVYGKAIVEEVVELGEDYLYDISIDEPHLYIDNYGIVHHNSFVGLKVSKNAQKINDEFIVIYIDTEMAFDFNFAESVGIDLDRLLVIQSNQIEEVQQQVMSIADSLTKAERKNVLMVIDSWGGLVTSKTIKDASSGNDAADFTVAKKKNTFAKLLTGLGMTVFVVNQVYDCGTDKMAVKTKEGKKSLARIEVGDSVLTTEGYQVVSDKFEYHDVPVYEIEMENGEKLEFTENHKFLVEREGKQIWVPVSELLPNDDIQLYDDQKLYTELGG